MPAGNMPVFMLLRGPFRSFFRNAGATCCADWVRCAVKELTVCLLHTKFYHIGTGVGVRSSTGKYKNFRNMHAPQARIPSAILRTFSGFVGSSIFD